MNDKVMESKIFSAIQKCGWVGWSEEPVILNLDAGWRIFASCAQLALYTRERSARTDGNGGGWVIFGTGLEIVEMTKSFL
jgi:hypothetical protein